MRRCVFLVPGRLDAKTGGTIYDKRIVGGLRSLGWAVDVRELDATFPRPTRDALDHAAATLSSIAGGGLVIVDGLAGGAMPEIVEREAARLRIVALVHLPLALEVGIDPSEADRLRRSERRTLVCASRVIVTGPSTVESLAGRGVTRDRIALVQPGTDPAPLARGSRSSEVHLLSVAALTKGKGHETLIRAAAAMPHRNWRLMCAGSLGRQPATVDGVRASIREHQLGDRVTLTGELGEADLGKAYDEADVFVLATLRETYGMAVAEALARGLPVVSTTTGAIPDLVGDAGLLVAPGDETALTSALARVVADAPLRTTLAAAARQRRAGLRTWDAAAQRMANVLEDVAADDRITC